VGCSTSAQAAGWSTPGEAFRLWFAPTTLRKTLKIALVVGIILSLINIGLHLPTPARIVLNFVVPFCVSSIGVLSATRRREPDTGRD
jgi:hypothetical protein